MRYTLNDRRRLVAHTLVCGMLCALALIVVQAARPESAQAAKVTTGWATGTLYFSKGETQGITEGGPAAVGACFRFVPPPYNVACFGAVAWVTQANRARNRDMCLKVKFLLTNSAVHWPDIYRGGYCS